MIIPFVVFSQQSISFNDYFIDKTMHVDYFHIGNAGTEILTIDHIYQYGIWAGSRKNLLDNFNNGAYYY
ncbi:MAG: peptidase M64, partial [Melioribacteraceae bacterium]